ncbi:TPA: hypothetical protein UDO34_000457 [Streptococcus suis]|nr:hypothetical protein [Streptococcus suis]
MIYLKDGNIPLNLAYDDDIVQEANSSYQLSFKFPLTDGKWKLLKREVCLLADDLHGEQDFFIFEAKKANGYVQVYAKQVASLLNYYSINSISVDRVPGQTAMTALAGSIKRNCPFTFFSNIMDRHTFNESNVSVMDALVKDKHSIVGQWGGDLVRDKYQVKLLKNGGIENESLFMYKKNLSSYEETENINNLKTRLHLKKTIQGQSEGEADRVIAVTVDSPLINQYSQIYETDIEVNDQDVTDVASLTAYGKRYFSSTLCDLVENSINLDVKGKSDVSVKMFDTVSVFHEQFDIDLRLKITSYHFGPMSKRLKSIGFGKMSQTFGSTVASMVAGSVDKATGRLSASLEQKLQKEIDNANRHFDAEFDKRVEGINDGIEQAQAEAERYADNIRQSINTEIAQVNQSMQAQSEEHDRQVADILSKTQSVESLANQAKADAASALARANQVKAEAIADARAQVATVSQALNAAKSELQSAIASADQKARDSQASATALRNDLNLQASKILAQAQAQTALTSRVSTVETLADGTKSTVTELSKTVSKATGDIASVTSRTKTMEDTLSQTRTQYETLTQTINTQTGQIDSINRKTADLQSGIDGVTERFENIKIGSRNYLRNASFISDSQYWYRNQDQNLTYNLNHSLTKKGKPGLHMYSSSDNAVVGRWKGIEQRFKIQQPANTDYVLSLDLAKDGVDTDANIGLHFIKDGEIKQQSWFNVRKSEIQTSYKRYIFKATSTYDVDAINVMVYVGYNMIANLYVTDIQLEVGNIASDFHLSDEDLRSEFATYIRTATENSAELVRRIETADGKAVEARTYAQQTATAINTRLESLETYKDAEGTRASQYLSASRIETAKQLSAERAAIASNYVAKSTYDENVRGTTLKLDEIKSTADTAKQNLATYQNTVDRKLEELTSSTQTLDGKINTASAKVDTVAGQIRTEISEVEGKIPTDFDGLNLMTGTRDWSTKANPWHMGAAWTIEPDEYRGLKVHSTQRGFNGSHQNIFVKTGDVVTFSFFAKATQPLNNVKVSAAWTDSSVYQAPVARTAERDDVITISDSWKRYSKTVHVTSDGSLQFRTEYGANTIPNGNKLYIAGLKLARSSVDTGYSENPTDLMSEIASVKTTITQTASGVEQLSTNLTTTNNKVSTAETKINQLIGDVSSKVSQSDYNTLTGRVDNAETAITQNAQEISRRLTSTQVESAITGKGYQTKSDVDNNITGRGYITSSALQPYALSTAVQTLVRETADSFSRTISETRALIPTEMSGNLILDGNRPWSSTIYLAKEYQLAEPLEEGKTYTLVIHWWRGSGASGNYVPMAYYNAGALQLTSPHGTTTLQENASRLRYDSNIDSWVATFTVKKRSQMTTEQLQAFSNRPPKLLVYRFGSNVKDQNGGWADTTQSNASFATLVKGNIPLSRWEPAYSELATVTALHSVRDTVDSHTRTISTINGTVSTLVQTAAGLVTEVSGTNGLKTQVSTLAGSYAIKNLTSSGNVLNQLNLNKDGSVKIDGKLVQITGTTYIQDGVITSAKIAGLDAGKINTGELNAARIKANSIDGSKIMFDQAFLNKMTANEAHLQQLFAKDAFLTAVQAVSISASQITGGLMRATNGAMEVNLNAGQILYYTDQAALKRVLNGYPTQFVKFATGYVASKGQAGVTVIGSNRWNSESSNDGGFVGIRAWNGTDIDQIDVVGDTVRLASSAFEAADGWSINTLPGKLDIDAFNADHRASSKIKVGDLWLWKNASTYSSMKETINLIIDNLQLLHSNKSTERAYSYTLPAKV